MLTEQLRGDFGRLNFALEGTNVPHQYRIKKFLCLDATRELARPSPGIVTLICHDPRYPPPNPILLSVHAAVANILNATGRAEVVGKFLQDYNETDACSR